MVTLFRNINKMSIGGVYCTLRIKTDGERLLVTVGPAAGARIYTAAPSMTVTYAGETAEIIEAERDVTVDFALTDEKSITVSDAVVWIDGVTYQDGCTFTWECDYETAEDVGITYSIDKVRSKYMSTLKFTVSGEENRILRPLEVSLTYIGKDGEIDTMSCDVMDIGGGKYEVQKSLSESIAAVGARIQYRIEAASFATDESGGEHVVGFGDVFTPNYIISGTQSTPYALSVGTPVAGCDVRVRWEALSDAKMFELEKSENGTLWTEIYSGTECEHIDRVSSGASTVAYRVRSSGSPWWESPTIEVRHSNMYIGTAGGIRPVAELYLGSEGEAVMIPPIITVGKG